SYVDRSGNRKDEDFDMVVLSVGLGSPDGVQSLAKSADIELNRYDFCRTKSFSPLNTTRPGIFVAGAFEGPKDIPESVTQATGSAAAVSEILQDARGSQIIKKEYPPEMDIGEEPRIGVLICRCGTNIAGVVDVPEVVRYASTLKDVVLADDSLYSCSQDGQQALKEVIQENDLNRIVVAACTPRTHEPLFQETMRDIGLNRSLYEMVNIRDQCSWVHAREPEEATLKAKDLVRMAVAKAGLLSPLAEQTVPVTPKALVIGGGIAGLTASLSIADQGFECILIEKSAQLGGNLRLLNKTLTGEDPKKLLSEVKGRVNDHPRITVHTNTEIESISGYVGNFFT
ncbi:MAG: FAD-dependent oxidoreductase, partial [Desulfobulbaceae bacterium]|nr:FAD-dependent oxidoreductase [Desulfobulbaceae bacterium]